jgi:hypothetical protein
MSDQVGVHEGFSDSENPSPVSEDPASDSAALARAYEQTAYRVLTPRPCVLRIGEASPELCRLHRERGVASSAFLSAANPGSRLLTKAENDQWALAFLQTLEGLGLAFVLGVGGAEDQVWPPEPSALIFGITLDEAHALGHAAGQRAFLWIGLDGVPSLVWID